MAMIKQKRQEILQKIAKVSELQDIKLIAVSKTFAINEIMQAYEAGQIDFAENYVQEALEKILYLNQHNYNLIWHFIGKIQSNKTNIIAQNFAWVHSVDREKIALRLNNQRPPYLGKLQICIQVNIDNASNKGGIIYNEDLILSLAKYIASLPNLNLRGLMAIPDLKHNLPNKEAFKDMYNLFVNLKRKLDDLNSFDTLCMGMSQDFELAIKNGGNMVRIGSALFGKRS